MDRYETDLESPQLQRNLSDFDVVREIARSGADHPVLMLNLNRYAADSGYPDGGIYREYIEGLGPFLAGVGGRVLWRFPILGLAVGEERFDEVLAAWYPSHQAFAELYEAPGAERNFDLKTRCCEHAAIHRCPAERPPFAPSPAEG